MDIILTPHFYLSASQPVVRETIDTIVRRLAHGLTRIATLDEFRSAKATIPPEMAEEVSQKLPPATPVLVALNDGKWGMVNFHESNAEPADINPNADLRDYPMLCYGRVHRNADDFVGTDRTPFSVGGISIRWGLVPQPLRSTLEGQLAA